MLMTVERTHPSIEAADANPDELLRWYIVRAYSGAEWQLRQALLKRSIDAYLPWYIESIRRNRWEQGEIRPLFRGYLWVGLELGQEFREVTETPGALHMLKVGDRVVEITVAGMEALRSQASREQMISWGVKMKVLRVKVGEWVAIPEGRPFEGTPVQVEAIDKRGQITASLGPGTVHFPLSALTEACRRRS